MQVPVKVVQGKLYVRVSAHVHNELSEFKQLAQAISALTYKVCCVCVRASVCVSTCVCACV